MAKKKDDVLTPEKVTDMVVKAAKQVAHDVEEIADEVSEDVKKAARKALKKTGEVLIEQAEALADASPQDKLIIEKKAKIAALREKAKALESKVKDGETSTIKEKVTGEKEEKKEMLVPIEDYLKSSIHLGTRVITPDMRSYVYRRRADGLAVFNTSLLDDKMREAIKYLSKFAPEEMIVVCKREAGWKAVQKFADTLGIKSFTKKYPSGVLTNTNLETFFETEMVFICDPWLDKNALADANRIKLNVMSVCDTNNFTAGINFVLPGNNKSWKSLGMIFYLLTKGYIETRKLDIPVPPVEEFVEGWETLQPPA